MLEGVVSQKVAKSTEKMTSTTNEGVGGQPKSEGKRIGPSGDLDYGQPLTKDLL